MQGNNKSSAKDPLVTAYENRLTELEESNSVLTQTIRELRQQVHEQKESRLFLLDLVENVPVGYVIHDSDGYIVACNRAARHLLGNATKLPASSITQLIASQDTAAWLEHIRNAFGRNRVVRTKVRLLQSDKKTIPVEFTTLAVQQPGRQRDRYYSIFVDITDRLIADEALRRTQLDYHQLIDTVEGIVWEADATTFRINFVSQYAKRLLGYPLEDWKRPRFWEDRVYVDDRERVANSIARAVDRREDLQIEYRVITASREVLWLHDTITFSERDGKPVLLGVAVDITARRRAEEELRGVNDLLEQRVAERTKELRQSLADLEAFSYSISHDLRSPIRAMLGFAGLAMEEMGNDTSPMVKDYLERISVGAMRADRLIQDVLTYSRLTRQTMRLEPVDLERLVRDLVLQFPEFQEPHTEVRIESPLLPVTGHEACLGQCITNLLMNAVKFVVPGKKPVIHVRTEPVSGKVRIWVEDNGIGIAPTSLNRIFGIFERIHSNVEYQGTGIGLAIVRKGADRMGGSVGVESQAGVGSRFWVQLESAKNDESHTPS